jgi:hypothetical protein
MNFSYSMMIGAASRLPMQSEGWGASEGESVLLIVGAVLTVFVTSVFIYIVRTAFRESKNKP